MSDSEDLVDPLDEIDEGGDDLFGDDDVHIASPKARILDDDDLASDSEGDHDARGGYDEDGQNHVETRDQVVMAVRTYRHRIPKPSDGVLRVLRVPRFAKFEPQVYDAETFQPSEFDLANARAENAKHVVRVKRNEDTLDLRSNTNIFTWSDGSVTISIGGEQYEIQKKALAPTPGQPYNELKDGHYYAAAAELSSNLLMTVGHVTEQYTVRPNKTVGDDALSILAERMAQANKGGKENEMIIRTTRDPELQKKQAEAAEKERIKAQRRRENAAARMDTGLGQRSRGGGLSISDLEGGRRPSAPRKRAAGASKPRRRAAEYDSDDDLPYGRGRQDEYDEDDGFVVGSGDAEGESGDDEDDDGFIDDVDEAPRSKRQRTAEPQDEDASGSDVEPAVEATTRGRRRNIVDDDDEE